jgi:hypothetical protein
MYTKKELLVFVSCFWSCLVYSQEISSLTLKVNKFSVDENVPVVLSFKSSDLKNSSCGLELNFGDGVIETIRAQQSELNMASMVLSHTYRNPGKYTINAEGKFYFRGLYSAIACSGQSKQVIVEVINDVLERSKDEAKNQIKIMAEKEVELQKREKDLQALQLQILSSRESELQRKEVEFQQKLEQADREKQASLQALNQLEKKVGQSIQTPEKRNVPRAKPSASVPVKTSAPASSPVLPTSPISVKGYKPVDGF